MAWWMSPAAILLFMFFHISARGGEESYSTISPAHRIDLKSVLKADAVPQLGAREAPWVPIITLHFLDNERLAATFVIPAKKTAPKLATRAQEDGSSPFRVRTAVINASTGRVLATPEWPSNSRAAGIISADDRGFVTQTGGKLTLVSPELKAVKQMNLPTCAVDNGKASGGDWSPSASWSGRRALLISGPVWSKSCWLWIDTERLQVLASWQDERTGAVAVSDDRLVLQPFGRHFGDPPLPLKVAMPAGDWKAIPETLNASTPQFVGPDLVYFHRPQAIDHPDPAEALLIRTDGSVLFRLETTPKGWVPGRAAVSRTGIRFVILQGQMKGGVQGLDIAGHSILKEFLVYDSLSQVSSYTIQVRESKAKNGSASPSPDGRHLAVLGYPEPTLEIFELPPLK
jgi:hypothetical protein